MTIGINGDLDGFEPMKVMIVMLVILIQVSHLFIGANLLEMNFDFEILG